MDLPGFRGGSTPQNRVVGTPIWKWVFQSPLVFGGRYLVPFFPIFLRFLVGGEARCIFIFILEPDQCILKLLPSLGPFLGGTMAFIEHGVPFSQSSRDCAICADKLPQLQTGLSACGAFPAEHVFCTVCLTTAMLGDSRCPLCREDLHDVGLVLGDSGETMFPDRARPPGW